MAKMSLAGVKRGIVPGAIRVLVYGPEGVGKSSLAADAPNPIFLGAEDGTRFLDVARFPQPDVWADALGACRVLETEKHAYESIVIDTADWLEPLCWSQVCREGNDKGEPQNNIESFGFGKGYLRALDKWRELLSALESLQRKGMNVIVLAHAHVKKFANPTGEDYDRYQLKLQDKASALLREWADAVLFASYDLSGRKVEQSKFAKTKGIGEGARWLYTTRTAAWEAKNRYGLPPKMALSWRDLHDKILRAQAVPTAAEVAPLLAEVASLASMLPAPDAEKATAAVKRAAGDPGKLRLLVNWCRAKAHENDESVAEAAGVPQPEADPVTAPIEHALGVIPGSSALASPIVPPEEIQAAPAATQHTKAEDGPRLLPPISPEPQRQAPAPLPSSAASTPVRDVRVDPAPGDRFTVRGVDYSVQALESVRGDPGVRVSAAGPGVPPKHVEAVTLGAWRKMFAKAVLGSPAPAPSGPAPAAQTHASDWAAWLTPSAELVADLAKMGARDVNSNILSAVLDGIRHKHGAEGVKAFADAAGGLDKAINGDKIRAALASKAPEKKAAGASPAQPAAAGAQAAAAGAKQPDKQQERPTGTGIPGGATESVREVPDQVAAVANASGGEGLQTGTQATPTPPAAPAASQAAKPAADLGTECCGCGAPPTEGIHVREGVTLPFGVEFVCTHANGKHAVCGTCSGILREQVPQIFAAPEPAKPITSAEAGLTTEGFAAALGGSQEAATLAGIVMPLAADADLGVQSTKLLTLAAKAHSNGLVEEFWVRVGGTKTGGAKPRRVSLTAGQGRALVALLPAQASLLPAGAK